MRTAAQLQAALLRSTVSPATAGTVVRICVRKGDGAHETPERVELTLADGVVGDRWTSDRDPERLSQVTMMSTQFARLIEHAGAGFEQAGDNFFVDLDLRENNLPIESRVLLGGALLEVTDEPHAACAKFAQRFGHDALDFINDKHCAHQRRRGVNCRVLSPGRVCVGDAVTVEAREAS